MYHRNIFGSSSKVFSTLRKSLDIFGNFRKFWENIQKRLSGHQNSNWKIFRNLQKVFGKASKRNHQYVYIIKRTLHVSSKIVYGNLLKSSGIFGNSRKMSGNVCLAFGTILENLRKFSESGRKSSENRQKHRDQ